MAKLTWRAKFVQETVGTPELPRLGRRCGNSVQTAGTSSIFHLPELPKRIVIQGDGCLALEFSTFSPGLGSSVLLVYRGNNILRGLDEGLRVCVRSEVEAADIQIVIDCTVAKVNRTVICSRCTCLACSSIIAG